jgi:hypothetical protein
MIEPGEVIDGRYEVEALLGEGGLAHVYRVRHLQLGSQHALKLLRYRSRALVDRLLLEGRIQAQLRHPNVVSVTDIVRHDGQLGLLMEYVDHLSLEELVERQGAMPLDLALDLMAPILAGVHAAHRAGVLHRDLKPANVLLARTARGLVPKVSDFGIAKVVSDGLDGDTRENAAMGTPGYMAPEQVLDAKTVDARTDVFALGAILYELLTGRRAFVDDTGETSVRATLRDTQTPVCELVPEVPRAISDAIDRALAKEREDRFEDVGALARALLAERPTLLALFEDDAQEGAVPLDFEPSARSRSVVPSMRGAAPTVGLGRPTIAPVTGADAEPGGGSPPPPRAGRRPPPFWTALGLGLALVVTGVGIGLLVAGPALGLVLFPVTPGPAAPAGVGEPAVIAADAPRVGADGPEGVQAPQVTPAGLEAPAGDPAPSGLAEPATSDTPATSAGSTGAARPLAPAPAGPSGAAASTSTAPESAPADVPGVAADPTAEPAPATAPASGTAGSAPAAASTPAAPAASAVAGATSGTASGQADADRAAPSSTPAASSAPPDPGLVAPSWLVGTVWEGKVFRQPFTLRILREQAGDVQAEGRFVLGATQRLVQMNGTFDAGSGRVVLREVNGDLVIEGTAAAGALRGSYGRRTASEALELARR